MICLIDRYFLLVLFLNLEYTHIRTHRDKHKFAHALYILKCNYFPDSFFNTWSIQSQDLWKLLCFHNHSNQSQSRMRSFIIDISEQWSKKKIDSWDFLQQISLLHHSPWKSRISLWAANVGRWLHLISRNDYWDQYQCRSITWCLFKISVPATLIFSATGRALCKL